MEGVHRLCSKHQNYQISSWVLLSLKRFPHRENSPKRKLQHVLRCLPDQLLPNFPPSIGQILWIQTPPSCWILIKGNTPFTKKKVHLKHPSKKRRVQPTSSQVNAKLYILDVGIVEPTPLHAQVTVPKRTSCESIQRSRDIWSAAQMGVSQACPPKKDSAHGAKTVQICRVRIWKYLFTLCF